MPALTVKGIPDELYDQLKERAAENRRSLNSEILVRLEQTVAAERVDAAAALARADEIRKRLRVPRLTDAVLRQARTTGRP